MILSLLIHANLLVYLYLPADLRIPLYSWESDCYSNILKFD